MREDGGICSRSGLRSHYVSRGEKSLHHRTSPDAHLNAQSLDICLDNYNKYPSLHAIQEAKKNLLSNLLNCFKPKLPELNTTENQCLSHDGDQDDEKLSSAGSSASTISDTGLDWFVCDCSFDLKQSAVHEIFSHRSKSSTTTCDVTYRKVQSPLHSSAVRIVLDDTDMENPQRNVSLGQQSSDSSERVATAPSSYPTSYAGRTPKRHSKHTTPSFRSQSSGDQSKHTTSSSQSSRDHSKHTTPSSQSCKRHSKHTTPSFRCQSSKDHSKHTTPGLRSEPSKEQIKHTTVPSFHFQSSKDHVKHTTAPSFHFRSSKDHVKRTTAASFHFQSSKDHVKHTTAPSFHFRSSKDHVKRTTAESFHFQSSKDHFKHTTTSSSRAQSPKDHISTQLARSCRCVPTNTFPRVLSYTTYGPQVLPLRLPRKQSCDVYRSESIANRQVDISLRAMGSEYRTNQRVCERIRTEMKSIINSRASAYVTADEGKIGRSTGSQMDEDEIVSDESSSANSSESSDETDSNTVQIELGDDFSSESSSDSRRSSHDNLCDACRGVSYVCAQRSSLCYATQTYKTQRMRSQVYATHVYFSSRGAAQRQRPRIERSEHTQGMPVVQHELGARQERVEKSTIQFRRHDSESSAFKDTSEDSDSKPQRQRSERDRIHCSKHTQEMPLIQHELGARQERVEKSMVQFRRHDCERSAFKDTSEDSDSKPQRQRSERDRIHCSKHTQEMSLVQHELGARQERAAECTIQFSRQSDSESSAFKDTSEGSDSMSSLTSEWKCLSQSDSRDQSKTPKPSKRRHSSAFTTTFAGEDPVTENIKTAPANHPHCSLKQHRKTQSCVIARPPTDTLRKRPNSTTSRKQRPRNIYSSSSRQCSQDVTECFQTQVTFRIQSAIRQKQDLFSAVDGDSKFAGNYNEKLKTKPVTSEHQSDDFLRRPSKETKANTQYGKRGNLCKTTMSCQNNTTLYFSNENENNFLKCTKSVSNIEHNETDMTGGEVSKNSAVNNTPNSAAVNSDMMNKISKVLTMDLESKMKAVDDVSLSVVKQDPMREAEHLKNSNCYEQVTNDDQPSTSKITISKLEVTTRERQQQIRDRLEKLFEGARHIKSLQNLYNNQEPKVVEKKKFIEDTIQRGKVTVLQNVMKLRQIASGAAITSTQEQAGPSTAAHSESVNADQNKVQTSHHKEVRKKIKIRLTGVQNMHKTKNTIVNKFRIFRNFRFRELSPCISTSGEDMILVTIRAMVAHEDFEIVITWPQLTLDGTSHSFPIQVRQALSRIKLKRRIEHKVKRKIKIKKIKLKQISMKNVKLIYQDRIKNSVIPFHLVDLLCRLCTVKQTLRRAMNDNEKYTVNIGLSKDVINTSTLQSFMLISVQNHFKGLNLEQCYLDLRCRTEIHISLNHMIKCDNIHLQVRPIDVIKIDTDAIVLKAIFFIGRDSTVRNIFGYMKHDLLDLRPRTEYQRNTYEPPFTQEHGEPANIPTGENTLVDVRIPSEALVNQKFSKIIDCQRKSFNKSKNALILSAENRNVAHENLEKLYDEKIPSKTVCGSSSAILDDKGAYSDIRNTKTMDYDEKKNSSNNREEHIKDGILIKDLFISTMLTDMGESMLSSEAILTETNFTTSAELTESTSWTKSEIRFRSVQIEQPHEKGTTLAFDETDSTSMETDGMKSSSLGKNLQLSLQKIEIKLSTVDIKSGHLKHYSDVNTGQNEETNSTVLLTKSSSVTLANNDGIILEKTSYNTLPCSFSMQRKDSGNYYTDSSNVLNEDRPSKLEHGLITDEDKHLASSTDDDGGNFQRYDNEHIFKHIFEGVDPIFLIPENINSEFTRQHQDVIEEVKITEGEVQVEKNDEYKLRDASTTEIDRLNLVDETKIKDARSVERKAECIVSGESLSRETLEGSDSSNGILYEELYSTSLFDSEGLRIFDSYEHTLETLSERTERTERSSNTSGLSLLAATLSNFRKVLSIDLSTCSQCLEEKFNLSSDLEEISYQIIKEFKNKIQKNIFTFQVNAIHLKVIGPICIKTSNHCPVDFTKQLMASMEKSPGNERTVTDMQGKITSKESSKINDRNSHLHEEVFSKILNQDDKKFLGNISTEINNLSFEDLMKLRNKMVEHFTNMPNNMTPKNMMQQIEAAMQSSKRSHSIKSLTHSKVLSFSTTEDIPIETDKVGTQKVMCMPALLEAENENAVCDNIDIQNKRESNEKTSNILTIDNTVYDKNMDIQIYDKNMGIQNKRESKEKTSNTLTIENTVYDKNMDIQNKRESKEKTSNILTIENTVYNNNMKIQNKRESEEQTSKTINTVSHSSSHTSFKLADKNPMAPPLPKELYRRDEKLNIKLARQLGNKNEIEEIPLNNKTVPGYSLQVNQFLADKSRTEVLPLSEESLTQNNSKLEPLQTNSLGTPKKPPIRLKNPNKYSKRRKLRKAFEGFKPLESKLPLSKPESPIIQSALSDTEAMPDDIKATSERQKRESFSKPQNIPQTASRNLKPSKSQQRQERNITQMSQKIDDSKSSASGGNTSLFYGIKDSIVERSEYSRIFKCDSNNISLIEDKIFPTSDNNLPLQNLQDHSMKDIKKLSSHNIMNSLADEKESSLTSNIGNEIPLSNSTNDTLANSINNTPADATRSLLKSNSNIDNEIPLSNSTNDTLANSINNTVADATRSLLNTTNISSTDKIMMFREIDSLENVNDLHDQVERASTIDENQDQTFGSTYRCQNLTDKILPLDKPSSCHSISTKNDKEYQTPHDNSNQYQIAHNQIDSNNVLLIDDKVNGDSMRSSLTSMMLSLNDIYCPSNKYSSDGSKTIRNYKRTSNNTSRVSFNLPSTRVKRRHPAKKHLRRKDPTTTQSVPRATVPNESESHSVLPINSKVSSVKSNQVSRKSLALRRRRQKSEALPVTSRNCVPFPAATNQKSVSSNNVRQTTYWEMERDKRFARRRSDLLNKIRQSKEHRQHARVFKSL